MNGVQGGNAADRNSKRQRKLHGAGICAQSENVTVTVALAGSPQQNYATAVVSIIAPAAGDLSLCTRESAGGAVLALPARAGKDGRSVRDDDQLRAEHMAGAYALSEWRRGANLCRWNAGPDALSHARPGHAEQRRNLQRCRPYLHDRHASGDFGGQRDHAERSDAAARHRDVEHHSARQRQPGLRHRSERQRDLDLQLSRTARTTTSRESNCCPTAIC